MMTKCTVTLHFQDANQPPIIQAEPTRSAAMTTARHLLAQFAGVKCLWLDDETVSPMIRHVADAACNHLFSVPIPRTTDEFNKEPTPI